MFYYPNVLQRHTGCFATIWLAATKGIQITRRECLKVNVGQTCDDIMDYVLVRVEPLLPDLPRPRFSLYLSCLLQYGVVLVYHRQCNYLLEEIQHTLERLIRSEKHLRIDMTEPERVNVNLPDPLSLLMDTEGALDPFFGVMSADLTLPSPLRLPQVQHILEAATPERSPVESPRISPEALTASPESITLREKEPIVTPAPEFEGVELPEVTARELDLLIEQPELVLLQPEREAEGPEERERERERERDLELLEPLPTVEQLVDTAPEQDIVLLLDEETGLPITIPAELVLEVTPPVSVSLPPLPPEREEDRERVVSPELPELDLVTPKRRRRQLQFIDPETQISQDALREQIEDPLAETQRPSQLLVQDPLLRREPPSDLFNRPCTYLHPDILALWKRCAFVTPTPLSVWREMEREREEERAEISEREELREMVELGVSQVEVSVPSEPTLEVSEEERSRILVTPETKWSPVPEVLIPLEGIPEEILGRREREPEEGLTAETVLGLAAAALRQFRQVAFDSLLPPDCDRRTAALFFYRLLELVSARILKVYQAEPYSIIIVTPGELYSY